MIIATFGPTSGWAGKTITREGDVFILQDHGPITAADVMEYDRRDQLVWANDTARRWVDSKASRPPVVELRTTIVATFAEGTEHSGLPVQITGSHLLIDGEIPIRASEVMEHHRSGQLRWVSAELQAKVETLTQQTVVARFAAGTDLAGAEIALENGEYHIVGQGRISEEEFREHRIHGRLVWASQDVRERKLAKPGVLIIAAFVSPPEDEGQVVTYEGDVFFMEGHGDYSPEKLVAFDREGRLSWISEEVREAIYNDAAAELDGATFAYRQIPEKARRVYAASGGSPQVDFLIVGAGSQCLVGLSDSCIIVKPGIMAGATGGGRFTEFAYADITGVEVNTGMLSAVLEVTTPAYQGKSKDYWRAAPNSDPYKVSNCLPGAKALFCQGPGAVQIEELRRRVRQAKQAPADTPIPAVVDPAEQIRKLAELKDAGVLTSEEFVAAKQKILDSL